MVWIKYLFIAIVASIVALIGVEFFYVNTDVVTVKFILGSVKAPLAWVMLLGFTAGVLLTLVIGFFVIMPLRWRVARLQRTVSGQETEIGVLKKSRQGVR